MLKLDSIKSTAEMNLKSYREDLGFSIDSEEYKKEKKMWDEDIEKFKKLYDLSLKAYDFYSNGDGSSFYNYKLNEIMNNENIYSSYIKSGNYTEPSYLESKKVYKSMAKNNNETALISDELFMSSLEDVDIWKSEYRNDNVYSHSAFYLPRRIERTYPIDLIVIGLICMISIGGYSYDREYGNQIELLYTQPISRNKYHIKSFSLLFPIPNCFGANLYYFVRLWTSYRRFGGFEFPYCAIY